MSKCRNCVKYKNEWCKTISDSPDPDRERECFYFSQMTYGDKIRKMNDVELSCFISNIYGDGIIDYLSGKRKELISYRDELIEYLKQEVKDEG